MYMLRVCVRVHNLYDFCCQKMLEMDDNCSQFTETNYNHLRVKFNIKHIL